jgi:Putative metal-binding motif
MRVWARVACVVVVAAVAAVAMTAASCGSDVERKQPPGGTCMTDDDCAPPATCGGGGVPGKCGCTFHHDADHDGYGDAMVPFVGCAPPAEYVLDGTDCNDVDPTINPGRAEVCDYKDNNCDGHVDESVQTIYYRDGDGDGFGDAKNTVSACAQPGGFLAVGGDCDDTRPDVHPGATEICDAHDNDCDGTVDLITRACDNACGPGMELCTAGLFGGCTAPPITTVPSSTTLVLDGSASFTCLDVRGKLSLGADVTVSASNWVRLESAATIDAGPRATIAAGGDFAILGTSLVSASELTITSGKTFSMEADSRLYLQGAGGVVYAGGGAAACSDGTNGGAGGAGGGARGGDGGAGGTCGVLHTGATAGAGGAAASDGAAGCACTCSAAATGGAPSGGAGGAPMAGGGGGGSGGAGGGGSAGTLRGGVMAGGAGGSADTASLSEPVAGGAGGGSGGTAFTSGPPCLGQGGAGGGLLRVTANAFVHRGLIVADGLDGGSTLFSPPNFSIGAGGGGGAGGSLVFHVASFDSTGILSAQGGHGGTGNTGTAITSCANAAAGGGGGGGGGRIFVTGATSGTSAAVVNQGNLLVAGGQPGMGSCGQAGGVVGGGGWTRFQ